MGVRDGERWEVASYFISLQVVAGDEQHDFGAQTDPPSWWLDFGDGGVISDFVLREGSSNGR